MTVTDPNTVGATPWYKSPVQISQIAALVSGAIGLFPRIGKALGLESPDAVNTAVTTTAAFFAVGASVVGSILRAKSTIQPLTLTQAGADNHPATAVAKETPK